MTGQPFPGNIIPQHASVRFPQSVLPFIPNPDRTGLVFGLQSNKSPAVPSVAISQYLWGYTLDHNLTSSQSIHFSQWQNSLSSPFFTFAPIVPSSNELQSEINDTELGSGFVLNYVNTLKSNLVVTAGADWIGEISGEHNAKNGVNFRGACQRNQFSPTLLSMAKIRQHSLVPATASPTCRANWWICPGKQPPVGYRDRQQLVMDQRAPQLQFWRAIQAYVSGSFCLPVLRGYILLYPTHYLHSGYQ